MRNGDYGRSLFEAVGLLRRSLQRDLEELNRVRSGLPIVRDRGRVPRRAFQAMRARIITARHHDDQQETL